jgi:preprotein translocase subunit YajC
MGKVILAASKSSSGSGSLVFLLIIVVLFGLLYFVTIRPQRNRQRAAMQTQREVGPGARVRTTAGMYATVVAVDGDDVILEIAPGVEVRYLRRAILEVVGGGVEPEPAEYEAPDAETPAGEAGTEPAADGFAPAADGVAPAADGVAPAADGVAPAADGVAPAADGAAPAEAAQTEQERPAG